MATATSAAQTLNQKVCQKYGWSCEFGQTEGDDTTTTSWYVDVVVGINDKRRFVCSTDDNNNNNNNTKKGKEKVSQLALDGLHDIIQKEESKQVKELKDVFKNQQIEILDSSSSATWERFWNEQPPNKVVGIDVEGNQISPPVLIQIATESYTILEVPINKRLSPNLQRLLDDDNIIKIFCDNFSHKDKISLGIPFNHQQKKQQQFLEPPIIDIESMMLELFGPVKVPRGLSKIISLLGCTPQPNVRLEKPKAQKGKIKGRYNNIGRYARIEQGKAKPLQGLHDLSYKERQYAALDAYCTLQAYKCIVKLLKTSSLSLSEEEEEEEEVVVVAD